MFLFIVKENPTVRVFYENYDNLVFMDLLAAELRYNRLLEDCSIREARKETLPTQKHKEKFLQDVEQEKLKLRPKIWCCK
uniref:Uncharacterized protein n=1 Tax=Romanomermis culicivorax TaxID=13658 RepID=A0A915L3A1_ROMCU